MLYDLDNEVDRQRFNLRIKSLLDKRKFVELQEKTERTLKQNSYLHLCINYLALLIGENPQYVKDAIYKQLVNRDIYEICKKSKLTDDTICYLRSSKDLTKEEMSLSIDRFINWCGQEGYEMPEPDNTKFLREIQVAIDKAKNWLVKENDD